MVFILGAGNDQSTNDVIDWLIRMKVSYLRINPDDRIFIRRIETVNESYGWEILFSLNNESKVYHLSQFTSFWHRKGLLTIATNFDHSNIDSEIKYRVSDFIASESKAITDLFIHLLEKKKNLGNFKLSTPNKMEVLSVAKQYNLDIPKTMITSSKEELMSFKETTGEIICKTIQGVFTAEHESNNYYTRTEIVNNEVIGQLTETFPSSLFQEKLNKLYEVRSFYFVNDFHSMAIFSQSDDKTKTDFRNYNESKPNRFVPYVLPENVQSNLQKLVDHFGFNTGSIDLVHTIDQRHVFLEINPVGQFGMVSASCNYDLEYKIALYLCGTSNHE